MRAPERRPYVVFTTQRTGSSWLMDLLNRAPGVEGHQEIFLPRPRERPAAAGRNDYPRFVEWRRARRRSPRPFSVFEYLDGLYDRAGAVGFKLMYSQLRLFPEIALHLAWRRVRIVHLVRRNHLDVIVSSAIRGVTGSAHATTPAAGPLRVRLEAPSLVGRIERLERNVRRARRIVGWLPGERVEVSYEALVAAPDAFRSVLAFLAPEASPAGGDSVLVKRQQRPRAEAIANYDEVERALAGTRWAWLLDEDVNLSSTAG
ncbi:MAG: sulfotransferase [Candidatus Binatia bacterium]